jgi:ATP-dependent Clp protease ATP-binding subunit ClpC
MTSVFGISRSLAQELERQHVAVEAIDRHTIVFRRVPIARGHYSKLETNLLVRQPAPSLPPLVCVDADLDYVGSRSRIADLFSDEATEGWRELRMPHAPGESFQSVLERVLAVLGFGGVEPSLPGAPASPQRARPGGPGEDLLREYGRNLTDLAREGRLPPVIGRRCEIGQLEDILLKCIKNKPALVGEAGVGKTAIVEGFAQRIAAGGLVAPALAQCRVVEINVGLLQAGASMRGEFEQRAKDIIELGERDPHLILYFDEIHTMLGAGNLPGQGDLANLLKPALARGALRVIGSTTPADYRRIEKDRALARRFATIWVPEPSPAETIEILKGLTSMLRAHHEGCEIAEETLARTVAYSQRYLAQRRLPDKAIDLLDEAMAHRRRVAAEAVHAADRAQAALPLTITDEDVAQAVERRTGIPVATVRQDEREKLLALEQTLGERVKGQPDAIRRVAEAIRIRRAAVGDTATPIGRFIFLGPSGVGKTELAKSLAAALFDDERALIRIDMSEYHDRHVVARLVGSPPGYVGYDEGGQLTEAVKRRPASVVLLDEIEKAHRDVLSVLLQILSDGRLTAGDGETVDFSHTVVILTSNLGNAFADDEAPIGFGGDRTQGDVAKELDGGRMRALRRFFRPEFVGRLESIRFAPLSPEALREILDLELEKMRARLGRDIDIRVSPAVKESLLREACNPDTGARMLQDVLRRRLMSPLSQMLLRGEAADGDACIIEFDRNGEPSWRIERRKPAEPAPARATCSAAAPATRHGGEV